MKSIKNEYSPRKSATSTVGESFQELLNAYRIQDKFNETNLITSWRKLMGSAIANRTSDIYIHKKKLYVTITSAPLKQELSYNKEKLMDIIKKEIGDSVISEIIIK